MLIPAVFTGHSLLQWCSKKIETLRGDCTGCNMIGISVMHCRFVTLRDLIILVQSLSDCQLLVTHVIYSNFLQVTAHPFLPLYTQISIIYSKFPLYIQHFHYIFKFSSSCHLCLHWLISCAMTLHCLLALSCFGLPSNLLLGRSCALPTLSSAHVGGAGFFHRWCIPPDCWWPLHCPNQVLNNILCSRIAQLACIVFSSLCC